MNGLLTTAKVTGAMALLTTGTVCSSAAQGSVQQDKVFAPDGQTNDSFARDFNVDGSTAVIGARNKTSPGVFEAGAVYVFVHDAGAWSLQATLLAPDQGFQDHFGERVAISGDRIVVGAKFDDHQLGGDAGSAYVFKRSGTAWIFEKKLIASDASANDFFGGDVVIEGNRILVGASRAGPTGGGAVYVFDQVPPWTETAILIPSFPGGQLDVFGAFCDLRGSRVVASNLLRHLVFVFDEDSSGWTETAMLFGQGFMGTGLAFDDPGERIFAGAPEDPDLGTQAGSVFVFEEHSSGWRIVQKLYADDPAPGGYFGDSVSVSGDRVVVGTDVNKGDLSAQGQVYVFERRPTGYVQTDRFTAEDMLQGASYGEQVAIDGGLVLAGAAGADGATLGTGAAYFHVLALGPEPYCMAKTTSQGCVPTTNWAGLPTWDGADDFLALTREAPPQKPGLFFWSTAGPASLPFLGGTLCALPPLVRTPVQLSTGAPPCDGGYAFHFSQGYMQQSGLLPGDRLWSQFWMRDPAHADDTGVALSDGLEFSIQLEPGATSR